MPLVVACVLVTPPPTLASPTTSQQWILTGNGFSAGTFQNVTLSSNLSLQLGPRIAPTNRSALIGPGPPGSADASGAYAPDVLRDPDGSYKMWYTGFDGARNTILLAVSPDGLNWTKRGRVLDASAGTGTPFVIRIGATYAMWFTVAGSGGPLGYLDEIYRATSLDGASWTIQQLALGVGPSGAWDGGTVSYPWIVQDAGGLYRMYYAGWDSASNVRIGVATSADLRNWSRWSGNPIVTTGPSGSWDSAAVAAHCVVVGSSWTMFYEGREYALPHDLGIARSTDGFNWTKDPSNPSITPESYPSWDDASVGSPDVFVGGPVPIMYFSGYDGSSLQIGRYMFSPPPQMTYRGTYFSPVFDSGAPGTDWHSLAWSAQAPPATSLSLQVRTGNTSTPDSAWTIWIGSAGNLPSSRDRYFQIRIDFRSTNWTLTPAVQSVTVTFSKDGSPDALPASPTNGTWTNAMRPILRWSATDPESDPIVADRVQLSSDPNFAVVALDSGNFTPARTSWQVPWNLTDGTWYWRAQEQDAYGAWGPWQGNVFHLDTRPPILSVSYPAPGQSLHVSTLNPVWTASDTGSGLDHFGVRLDGGPVTIVPGGNSSLILNGVSDGAHTIVVTAFDRAGNVASVTLSVTIDTNVFSVDGPYGAAPLAATIAAVAVAGGLVATLSYRRRRQSPPKTMGS